MDASTATTTNDATSTTTETNDFWLVATTNPDKINTFSSDGNNAGVALLCSTQKRDEYISKCLSSFENGFTVKKISSTNLEELRDELIAIFPPSSSQLPPNVSTNKNSIEMKKDNNYDNDNGGDDDHDVDKTRLILKSQQSNQEGDPEFQTHQENFRPVTPEEIKRFELFRSVIQHEDDLLNQRVSWIILAQSFLMAAYITSSGPNSLRFVTACVGLATVVVTMPAIIAAGQNIELQQEVYFRRVESEERCHFLHGHGRDVTNKSTNEMINRKEYGHLLPTMAFRGKASIRILKTVIVLSFVQFFGWIFLLLALLFDDVFDIM